MADEYQLIALGLIAFSTSTLAGVFGFGGGMLIIGALPNFLPAAAIIPVHSAVQWVSNASRAVLGLNDIDWQFVRQHFIGSILGIALAYWLFANIDLSLIPLFIGVYILFHTWSPAFSRLLGNFDSFYTIGAIQTGLSLLVGAPGPIPLPLLIKKIANHHRVVCTMAVFMTTGHTLKLVLFLLIGFSFVDYWQEILLMAVAAAVGSWLGTKWRHRINAQQYTGVVKVLLTLIALLAIYRAIDPFSPGQPL